jgi:hypothetical protein
MLICSTEYGVRRAGDQQSSTIAEAGMVHASSIVVLLAVQRLHMHIKQLHGHASDV